MKLNRRTFLKGLGAGVASSALLPVLPNEVFAQENGEFPKRVVIMFSANGTVPFRWEPQGDENNWSFRENDILRPLEPIKEDLLVLQGVDMISTRNGIGDGHQKGMGHMLTGTELLPGPFQGGGNAGTSGYAGGISIDQYIANQVHNGEKYKTLTLGVKTGGSNNWSRMSYTGADQPVNPRENPFDLFDNAFGDLDMSAEQLAVIREQKKSVLDFVAADVERFKNKVGAADKQRIEQHFQSIREVEQSLTSPSAFGANCAAPQLGQAFDPGRDENFEQTGDAMMDLIVMAFACNLTRVATLQWSRSVSNISHPWADVTDRHHDLSHESDGNMDAVEKLVKINQWYARKFKYLVDKMKAIPEGDGTMLDNTIIVWCNELGKGNSHTRNDVPYILAGSCGDYFKTGRYLRYNADPHNNLLVSLANAMGVETNTFGNPAYCSGPLDRLRG